MFSFSYKPHGKERMNVALCLSLLKVKNGQINSVEILHGTTPRKEVVSRNTFKVFELIIYDELIVHFFCRMETIQKHNLQ